MNSSFDKVVVILTNKSHELRELVNLTGRDKFRFFNGADLTGLDLSKQDLTGMNFDGTDLRFSNLGQFSHDPGCFNNSILNSNQNWLRDEFEYNATEISNFPVEELQAFVRMRPSIIDTVISMLGITFERFATRADLSLASLRKARQGKVVAVETAQSVLEACRLLLRESGDDIYNKYVSLIEQPCASLLVGGNNSPFRILTHAGLNHLLLLRRLRLQENFVRYKGNVPEYMNHRDTAEYLRYFEGLVDREDLYVDGKD